MSNQAKLIMYLVYQLKSIISPIISLNFFIYKMSIWDLLQNTVINVEYENKY